MRLPNRDLARIKLPATGYRVALVIHMFRTVGQIAKYLKVSTPAVRSALEKLQERKLFLREIARINKASKRKKGIHWRKKKKSAWDLLLESPPLLIKKEVPTPAQEFSYWLYKEWGSIERYSEEEHYNQEEKMKMIYRLYRDEKDKIVRAVKQYKKILDYPDRYTLSVKVNICDFFLKKKGLLRYESIKRFNLMSHEYYKPLDSNSIKELAAAIQGALENKRQIAKWAESFGPIVWRIYGELTNKN